MTGSPHERVTIPAGDRGLVATRVSGPDGPTLVCLHGFATDRHSWDPVLDRLASVGTTVALDRPGFGETPLGADTAQRLAACSVDGEAQILVTGLDAVGPSVLVGHSAGSLIAAAVALEAPQLVRGLVLEAPAISADLGPPPPVRAFARTAPGRLLGPALLRLGAPLALRAGLRRSYTDREAAAAAQERMTQMMRRAGWADDFWDRTIHWSPPTVFDRLGELDLPVLVVAGAGDRLVRRDQVEAVAAAVDGAVLAVVEGAGHLPHEERPEGFTDVVLPFLASL